MKQWDYVLKLVRFALRANGLLYLSVVLSLFSVAVELLAMSSLFPIFQLVANGGHAATGMVVRGLRLLGFHIDGPTLLWTFIALLALRIVTQIIGQTLSMLLGKRVQAQLGAGAFDRIVHGLSIREINEKSIGFYVGLAGDESFRASTLIISLSQFVSTAALAALYFVAIAVASRTVAGLLIVFLVCCSLALIWVLKLSHRLGAEQTYESRKAQSVFLDALNNLKTVRAFSAEKYVADMYRTIIFFYTRILFWIDEVALLARLVPILLLIALFSIWMVSSEKTINGASIALLVTMIVYLMRFFPTIGEGARLLFKIVSDARSGKDVTEILTSCEEISDQMNVELGKIDCIDFRHVGFSYSNDADTPILKDFTCHFRRGKSYAVIGKSGIGKSTMVDIMMRFYPPTEGELQINNILMSRVRDGDIRRGIIMVGQETAIFDDTVANNVALGLQVGLADVQMACEVACIHESIAAMPLGYQTRLQYQGKNLSGGQRQRIALARALIRKPDVLILDESVSALDKEGQNRVVGNLLAEYREKLLIFITHDPAIMGAVDEVMDFEEINRKLKPRIAASDGDGARGGGKKVC
ncbi:MAG: ATP-binding cassette domain-containing protein [Candidatus Micrarchaeaceae archaeon]